MRRCPTPILLVPPRCRSTPPAAGALKVLAGLDESPPAEQVLAWLPLLGAPAATEVVLLEVLVPPPPGYGFAASGQPGVLGVDHEREAAAARRYLGRVTEQLTASGHRAHGLVRVGDAAATIVEVAAEHRVDLVALATHGRTGLLRLALGSVAAETIRLATTPILLVGPQAVVGAPGGADGQAGRIAAEGGRRVQRRDRGR